MRSATLIALAAESSSGWKFQPHSPPSRVRLSPISPSGSATLIAHCRRISAPASAAVRFGPVAVRSWSGQSQTPAPWSNSNLSCGGAAQGAGRFIRWWILSDFVQHNEPCPLPLVQSHLQAVFHMKGKREQCPIAASQLPDGVFRRDTDSVNTPDPRTRVTIPAQTSPFSVGGGHRSGHWMECGLPMTSRHEGAAAEKRSSPPVLSRSIT